MLKSYKLFLESIQDDNDIVNPIENIKTIEIDGIFYHGSTLNEDDEYIHGLSTNFSDYSAVWFSDNEYIADDFSDNWHNEDDTLKIIYEVYLKSDGIAYINYELSRKIMEYYGYFDFRECIVDLVSNGYDGWKTTGSIGRNVYDDYAIFDNSLIDIKKCKLYINDEWTDYISLSDANEIFDEWKKQKLNL